MGESILADDVLTLFTNNPVVFDKHNSLTEVTGDGLMSLFETNAVAPLMLTKVSDYLMMTDCYLRYLFIIYVFICNSRFILKLNGFT